MELGVGVADGEWGVETGKHRDTPTRGRASFAHLAGDYVGSGK